MGHAPSGHGELTKVVADHLGLDLDFNEVLTVVNGNASTHKLREDGHVSAVRANGFGAGALHTGEEMLVLGGHATAEAAADTGRSRPTM